MFFVIILFFILVISIVVAIEIFNVEILDGVAGVKFDGILSKVQLNVIIGKVVLIAVIVVLVITVALD